MTVLENMLVPALSDSQGDRYKHHQKIVRQAQELLKFVQLGHMKDQLAKTLSGGQNTFSFWRVFMLFYHLFHLVSMNTSSTY